MDQVGRLFCVPFHALFSVALHKLEHSPSRTNLTTAETVGPLVVDQLDVPWKVQRFLDLLIGKTKKDIPHMGVCYIMVIYHAKKW